MAILKDNVFRPVYSVDFITINGTLRRAFNGKVDITEDLRQSLPQPYLDITGETYGNLPRNAYIYVYESKENYPIFTGVASEPVNGHVDGRMTIVNTLYTEESADASVSFSPAITCTINGIDYFSGYCGQYACYYLNQNRGWDCFLFEGNCYKSSEYERMHYNKKFVSPSTGFGINTYRNQQTDSYILSTGRLSDVESELFAKHVASSPKVYLHNLATGEIIEGYFTDTEVEHQTYKGNGNGRSVYTVKFEKSKKQLW